MRKTVVLVLAAGGLASACSVTNVVAPNPSNAAPVCPARLAAAPAFGGRGTVVKLLSQAEAMTLLARTQRLVGRPIDASYLNNRRATIRADDGSRQTILVPYGMTVAVGDRVAYQTAYLNTAPLCTYVPNLATRKLSAQASPP